MTFYHLISPFATILGQNAPSFPQIYLAFCYLRSLALTFAHVFCIHSHPSDLRSKISTSNLSLTTSSINIRSPLHKSLSYHPTDFFL